MTGPQRTLDLKGVVLGCAGVGKVESLSELRIGNDPVFREESGLNHRTSSDGRAAGDIEAFIGASQNRAAFSDNSRDGSRRAAPDAVKHVERVRGGDVVAVGQRIPESRALAQVLRAPLCDSIDRAANSSG